MNAEVVHKILGTLDQFGALHIRKLAERARVSTRTLARYIPLLEERGLVKTIRERKWRFVIITEEGMEYLRKMEESLAILA